MKKNFKATIVFCLTATLFCMSAPTASAEEPQEISMNSCKEPAKEDCQAKDRACSKKKADKPARKSAARHVIEGS